GRPGEVARRRREVRHGIDDVVEFHPLGEGENSVHGAHCPVRHRARRAAARRGTPGGPLFPGPSAAGLAPPAPEERRGAPAPPAADDPAGFPTPPLLPCSAAPHPAAAEPRAAAILPP